MADGILVLAEHDNGTIRETTYEVLGLAHRLAGETGRGASVLLLGSGVGELAESLAGQGGAEVLTVDAEPLAHYSHDGWGGALEAVVAEEKPWLVLGSHGPTGWDLLPRLAGALEVPMATEVTDIRVEGGAPVFTRKAFNGKFQVRLSLGDAPPYVASVQRGAHAAASGLPAGTVRALAPAEGRGRLRTRFQEVRSAPAGGVDLTQADIIVAGGRGIPSEEKMAVVRDLAEALGGQVGASRPLTDAGWLPAEHQVGSSGITVAPRLYIAAGISGAIQHVMGMKGSGYIVAVNKDPEAPIFQVADVGVVGDLFEVLPALTAAVKASRG